MDDSDKESEKLWQAVIRTVTPIKRDKDIVSRSHAAAPPPPLSSPNSGKRTVSKNVIPCSLLIEPAPQDKGRGDEELRVGLDRRTAERLRRGKMKIDGRLDLHGLKQDEAHETLVRFLQNGYERGHRCVLVITGKGRSAGSEGVLKRRVPEWLTMAPLRDVILQTTPARPQDGGEGALYVLLRRRRS